jgi:hypothetical protein
VASGKVTLASRGQGPGSRLFRGGSGTLAVGGGGGGGGGCTLAADALAADGGGGGSSHAATGAARATARSRKNERDIRWRLLQRGASAILDGATRAR